LLGTLLLGAGIPLLEFLPIFQEDNPVVVYFHPISEGSYYVESAVNEVVTTTFFDWGKFFIGLYLLGVAIFSLRFFIGLGKIYALYWKSEVIKKENHTLVLTDEPHLPFSFFKYMFWSKDLEMNDVDGQKIVMHEVAHVKGWHSIDVILLEIFSIIFWVSPMVYFYKKSLKTVHEYLADAVVLQTTPTKKYGHLLLRQSQSGLQIALANHFFHSQLKQRIVMMTRSKSRKEAIVKYLFALPVILLLLIAFSKKEAIANNENVPTENIEAINLGNSNTINNVEVSTLGEVDEMPRYPGCEEILDKEKRDKCAQTNLLTFIYSNIKYPAEARKAGIQGRVIVKFTVLEDGTVAKTKIARDIGGGCGAAALKVINALPKMIPGQKDGKAVAVEMTIPVSFKLEGDVKKSPKVEKKTSEDTSKDVTVVGFAANQNSTKVVEGKERVYKVVEEMPRFKNEVCEQMEDQKERKSCSESEMLKFLYSNIKYPKAAKEAEINGRVIAKFVVQKDGSIAKAEVLRDIGGGCGDEVLRIINSMPEWIPGKQKGEAVNVSYVLPISFKLSAAGKTVKKSGTDEPIKIDENNIKFNKDMKPLFIVDGKEFDKSAAGELKPDDIKTVNVLKGEKATDKYGDKGKNGVVEIILKKGSSTKTEIKTHPIKKKSALEEAGLTYVKISPNPTGGNINIEYGSQDKPMTVSIFDINGKRVFEKVVAGGRSSIQNVDLSKDAKGIFFVTFEQDGKIYKEKVILQ
jgi:TonB family protein